MNGSQNGGGQSAFGNTQSTSSGQSGAGGGQPGFGGGFSGAGGFGGIAGVCLPIDDDATYAFTISSGAVTAMTVTIGSHTGTVTLSSADSFVVGTDTVTETITGTSSTQTITYTLESGSTTAYQVTSETLTVTTPSTTTANGDTLAYGFTVSSGSVTAETVTFTHGTTTTTHTVTPPSDAVFVVGTSSITETWAQGNEVISVTYVQPSGGTGYAVSSQQVTIIPEGTATTALSIDTSDRASFTISSGAVTAVSAISASGTSTAVTIPSNVTYTVLETGFVEETITHGTSSKYVIYYDASGSGTYTEVAHGTGTVDLTGLKAQIAELPSAVAALI